MLNSLLSAMFGFVDSFMVGQLGESVIAGVGNAAQLTLFGHLLFTAVLTGGAVCLAQAFGGKDAGRQANLVATLVQVGGIAGLLLALLFGLAGTPLAAMLTLELANEPATWQVAPVAGRYLQILAFAFPLLMIGEVYAIALQSSGDTRTPVAVSLLFNAFNILANWVLIFGAQLPGAEAPLFTPMGYQGAALASALSYLGQGAVMIWLGCQRQRPWRRQAGHFSLAELRAIISVGWPMSVDALIWQLSRACYTLVMNAINPAAFAGYVILRTFKTLFMLPATGMQQALAIVCGQQLGRRAHKRARLTATSGIKLSLLVVVLPAILMALGAELLPRLYQLSAETQSEVRICMLMLSLTLFATAINTAIPGILRSGGDSQAIMRITMISFLCVGGPGCALFGLLFGWGMPGAFAAICLEEWFKALLLLKRLRQYVWLRTLTAETTTQDADT